MIRIILTYNRDAAHCPALQGRTALAALGGRSGEDFTPHLQL